MVENMPFLDSEHVAMGEKAPYPKSTISFEWEETSSEGQGTSTNPVSMNIPENTWQTIRNIN